MPPTRRCSITGCDALATHRAEIVIYAKVAYLHTPSIGTMDLCVCDAHADETHARGVLTPEGKQRIAQNFAAAGYAAPDWTRSYVRWKRLEVTPATAFTG